MEVKRSDVLRQARRFYLEEVSLAECMMGRGIFRFIEKARMGGTRT
jgi:hypothetical protein